MKKNIKKTIAKAGTVALAIGMNTFSLDQGVDLQVLQESISADDSLALIMFDIGCYRDRVNL